MAVEPEDDASTTGTPATTSSVNAATTGSTTSATQGAGGSVTASAGGAGGGSSSSSTGGSMNNCAHDVCTLGIALTLGCGDPCVDTVCGQDSYCCDTEWDQTCIDEAVDFCSASCTVAVLPGDLVITEIMNNPSAVADTAGEWFELHNVSQNPIDLQGMSILHQANMPTAVETIAQSVVVPPGGFVVLGVNGDTTVNGNVSLDYVYSATVSLNNTTDYLAIQDATAVIIDELTYSETSGLDPSGKSRNLDPSFMTALDNDSDMHFCEATSTIVGGMDQGTPGAPNDICPP
jgi:hypothetical protein